MERVCPTCNKKFHEDLTNCPDDGSPLFISETKTDLVGKEIDGRFKVIKLLGTGGMGSVYLAKQFSVDRNVALKVLRKELVGDATIAKRFFIEAQAASKLRHPNTIIVYDFGQTKEGMLYIAMEYLDGKSLRDMLNDQGALPLAKAVKVITQVADSLSEAHRINIIHRDLKPENIFLTTMGEGGEMDFVKVLDFGIAKVTSQQGTTQLTKTGAIAGTPYYMSPEMILGEKVDARADIYAMGIIFYEMLAGLPPFMHETPMMVMMKHLHEDVKPVTEINPQTDVPETIHKVLMKTLSKERDKRPESAVYFRELVIKAFEESKTKPSTKPLAPMMMTSAGTRVIKSTSKPEISLESFKSQPKIEPDQTFIMDKEKQSPSLDRLSQIGFKTEGEKTDLYTGVAGEMTGKGKKWIKYAFIGAVPLVIAGIIGLYFAFSPSEKASVEGKNADSPQFAALEEKTPKIAAPKTDQAQNAPSPPVPAQVVLDIRSLPSEAEVFINRKKEGITPVKLTLNKGDIELILKKEGFVDRTEKFIIEKDSMFEFTLEKKPEEKKTVSKPVQKKSAQPATEKPKKKQGDEMLEEF
jgi:serine/threonine protein kinase